MTPIEYLNAAKGALHVQTNYALAKALEVPEPSIGEIYKGKRGPSEETIAKLALALSLPIGEVLADIRAQTAKTEKSKEFWKSFLSRTRAAALTLALLTFGAFWYSALGTAGGGFRVRWKR